MGVLYQNQNVHWGEAGADIRGKEIVVACIYFVPNLYLSTLNLICYFTARLASLSRILCSDKTLFTVYNAIETSHLQIQRNYSNFRIIYLTDETMIAPEQIHGALPQSDQFYKSQLGLLFVYDLLANCKLYHLNLGVLSV